MNAHTCRNKSNSGSIEYQIVKDCNDNDFLKILKSLDEDNIETSASFTPLMINPKDYAEYFHNIQSSDEIPTFDKLENGYDEHFNAQTIGKDRNNRTFIEAVLTDYFYKIKRAYALSLIFIENAGNFTESNLSDDEISDFTDFSHRKVKNLRIYWKGRLNSPEFLEAIFYGIEYQ